MFKVLQEKLISFEIKKILRVETSKGIIEVEKCQIADNIAESVKSNFVFNSAISENNFSSLSVKEKRAFESFINNYLLN